jgi:asparagine synthase (glutamine-hydrolysing)
LCGIVGQLEPQGGIDHLTFDRMRDTLAHRGPDDWGSYFDDTGTVALGHRRLAFLDLSEAGRQPMSTEDQRFWITFNGEIYNYLELKETLEDLGHRFRTGTDTEVILAGFQRWGIGVLHRLKGMFAFGLYDRRTGELLLVRDRFGIKPLYYHDDGQRLLFASELKAILASGRVARELDKSSVWDYFAYRYVPSPKTIWKGINKLPPAHYLLRRRDGSSELREYWRIPLEADCRPPVEEVVTRVDQMLLASVQQHVRSDVPVGSFLSGGYDSSALVYYMSRLGYPRRTFAIGFADWDDSEHQHADVVARQFDSQHTNRIVAGGTLGLVEELMYYYDEPIADISIIPTYVVSQEARRHVRTVLSGEGADELFGGYTWHHEFQESHRRLSWWSRFRDRFANGHSFGVTRYGEYMAMGRFRTPELRQLLHGDLAPPPEHHADWWYSSLHRRDISPLKAIQYLDMKAFMGELVLTKIDRASMAHSLEVRVPFLDHEIYEYFGGLHEEVYFRAGCQKPVLQEILRRQLPPEILRRPKRGFVGPDRYYMEIEFYAELLREGALLRDELVRREYVEQLIRERDHWRLWKIMVFEYWYRRWV